MIPLKVLQESELRSGDGGCADCIAPTLGLDTNYKRIVDNAFPTTTIQYK